MLQFFLIKKLKQQHKNSNPWMVTRTLPRVTIGGSRTIEEAREGRCQWESMRKPHPP